jgi:hypothetical protein
MKLNGILLPLLALAGFACASKSYATPPAETAAEVAAEVTTEAAATKLPEVRYYVIADT